MPSLLIIFVLTEIYFESTLGTMYLSSQRTMDLGKFSDVEGTAYLSSQAKEIEGVLVTMSTHTLLGSIFS